MQSPLQISFATELLLVDVVSIQHCRQCSESVNGI